MTSIVNFGTVSAGGLVTIVGWLVYTNSARISDAVGQGITIIFYWLLSVATLAGAILAVLYWMKEKDRRNRVIDGSLALQRQKTEDGGEFIIDMNKSTSGVVYVSPVHGVHEYQSPIGPDRQLAYARDVQTTRHLATMQPGDDALVRGRGMIEMNRRGGIGNATTAKWLEGNYRPKDTRIIGQDPAALPAPPVAVSRPEIQPQQMIAQAQPTQLVIGQDSVSGEIAQVNLELYPFIRLHGSTQSGKTSLGRFLVAQAIRHGFEVIIYDRRRGKDWGIFGQHAEIVDARDPSLLADALAAEVQRYGDRDAELGRNSAPNLSALAAKTGQAYRRRLIVIEELGTQHVNAKDAGRDVYKHFLGNLRKLTAEAGATGIHGLYIDQIPDAWDQGVRYNASGAICFHLPDHGGQVAGYQEAHKLATYHCHFDGQIVRAGYLTEAHISQTIGQVAMPVASGVRGDYTPPVQGENTPANTPTNTQPTNTDSAQWEELAAAFFEANPDASQRALTRAMSKMDSEGRPPESFLGGLSSDLFHRFSPRGNNYQPQPRADAYGWIPEPGGTK